MFVFVSNQIKLSLTISLMASDDKDIMIYCSCNSILFVSRQAWRDEFCQIPHDSTVPYETYGTTLFGCHPNNVFFPQPRYICGSTESTYSIS